MRFITKSVARVLALFFVLPGFLVYSLSAALFGSQKAFPGWCERFSLVPGLWGVYVRHAFFGLVLPRCDADAYIGFATLFSHPTAELGRNVYVGPFCSLGEVTLQDDVLLGSHVSIVNGGSRHGSERIDIPIREQPGKWPRITIGKDSWIGDRAIIFADVGEHCVVGAGSVVTKPVPDFAIAVGVPARVIGYLHRPQMPAPRAAERFFLKNASTRHR